MATVYVTYLGDPGQNPDRKGQIDGMDDWTIGETRAFSDEYAKSISGPNANGGDFGLFFATVQNANFKTERFHLDKTNPAKTAESSEPSQKPAETKGSKS